jgi:hypothetical protein
MAARTVKAPKAPARGRARAEKQQKLLQDLPAGLRKHVARIKTWFEKHHTHTLQTRYELGQHVRAIHDAESQGGREAYGKGIIGRLAEVFGWDDAVLYGALQIARAYTEAEIRKLTQQRRADHQPLPYSHVRALATVDDKKRRKALLDRALAECWTAAELGEAIRKAGGSQSDGTQGRKLVVPRDLPALLRQQESIVEDFLKRSRNVWEKPSHSLMHEATRVPADKLTQERVEEVRAHAERLREMSRKAQEQAEEAERAHAYLLDKLAKAGRDREAQAPSPATPAGDSGGDGEASADA